MRHWKKLVLVVVAFGMITTSMAMAQEAAKTDEALTGFTWGGDQRLREVYTENILTLRDSHPAYLKHFQRYRTRLWGKLSPTEDVDINARLVWEWRNWCANNENPMARPSSVNWDEALFDKMNINFKNAFNMPLEIKVGRQDIILGNGWLVLDGTPLDGSRTIFFDAARFTYTMDDNTFDLMYINQNNQADETIEPFNDQEGRFTEQDEQGIILNVTNKTLIQDGTAEGFLMWKKDNSEPGIANSNDSNLYTFGARIAGAMDENWKYRAEFAEQLGQKNDATVCAFGFNSQLSYHMNDVKKTRFHAGYEYLSGDDPETAKNEAFDSLWGRWPQWSELYIYTYALEGRIAQVTNLHRPFVGADFAPTSNTELSMRYHLLFRAQDSMDNAPQPVIHYSDDGIFRGQLFTTKLKYNYTKYISGHLLGEFFFPGNFYSQDTRDWSTFLRYELMFKF
ncbi:MAG: alginate export family protein [Phycisphaerae bacterium]|nr:alginate export family protein [Phycisphaerae bacterium]